MVVPHLIHGPIRYQTGNDRTVVWWTSDILGANWGITAWFTIAAPFSFPATTKVVQSTDGRTVYAHYLDLVGLVPGTFYQFKIQADQFESQVYSFTTPRPEDTIRAGVFAEPVGVMRSPVAEAAIAIPGLDGTLDYLADPALGNVQTYLGAGGYVVDGRNLYWWEDSWLRSDMVEDFLSKGFAGCRGVSDGDSELAQAILPFQFTSQDYFELPLGAAHIVGLNSIPGRARRSLVLGGSQATWLLQDAITNAQWLTASYRILLINNPFRVTFWNADGVYGNQGTQEDLLGLHELVKVSGADLVIYGTSRSYQRGAYPSTYPKSSHLVHHFVVGGGGGKKHEVRSWVWAPPQEPGIVSDRSAYSALVLVIGPDKLVVEAHDMEAEEVFETVTIYPHKLT